MSRVVRLPTATLTDRHAELTRQVILDAALKVLQQHTVSELTVRAVARQAGIAERTVFRYYAMRDELLDAVAVEVGNRLELPPPPATLEELLVAPRLLYGRFEANVRLTKAALHTELYDRMRETQGKARWQAVQALLEECVPRRSERDRRLAAGNIRYYLSATTWHYFRFYYGFDLPDAVAAAELAIRQSVDGLGVAAAGPQPGRDSAPQSC